MMDESGVEQQRVKKVLLDASETGSSHATPNASRQQVQKEVMDASETRSSRIVASSSRDEMDNPRRDEPCLPGEPLMTPYDLSSKLLGDGGRIAPSSSVLLLSAHSAIQKSVMDPRQLNCASPATKHPRPTQSLAKAGQKSAQRHEWSDSAVLYFTLVADGALPDGFLRDFLRLTPWVSAAAQRQAAQLARTDDLEAALFLHHDEERRKALSYQEKSEPNSSSQQPPHHRRSSSHDSTTRAFRSPPPGKTKSQNVNVGYSCSPIFSLAQIRRWEDSSWQDKEISLFLAQDDAQGPSEAEWETFGISWRGSRSTMARRSTTDQSHLTDFLQVRLSEPCNHGSLKNHARKFRLPRHRLRDGSTAAAHSLAALSQHLP